MPVSRKSNRLSPETYVGKQVYFLTINPAERSAVFVDKTLVDDHLSVLRQAADIYGFDVLAFCFMPDHLHLLAAGKSEAADLIAFVKKYKQTTGFAYKRQTGRTLWQKSFYDHVLRKEETIADCVKYILANPVRKGLVGNLRDYSYSGSPVYGDRIFEGVGMMET